MKLMWLGYLVYSLGNCVMKLLRPVSIGFHGGFHAHEIRCHIRFLHETGRRDKDTFHPGETF